MENECYLIKKNFIDSIEDIFNFQEIEKIIPSQMVSDAIQAGNYDARSFTYTIAKLLVTYVNNDQRTDKGLVVKDPEERLSFETTKIGEKQLHIMLVLV